MDFGALKRNKGKNLKAMTEKLKDVNGGFEKDPNIYKPGFDKSKPNCMVKVRLLVNKNNPENPLYKRISHAFKGPGGWYMENSRTLLGKEAEDPVAISNRLYWNKGESEADKTFTDIARARKRTTKFFANVYVISDPLNRDAEGQVKVMEFGKQLFDVIQSALNPEKFDDDDDEVVAFDPFDFWTGADLKIKMSPNEMPGNSGQKIIVPNYEKSEFARNSEFMDGDEEALEEIFNKTIGMDYIIETKEFDVLAKRFKEVTGEDYNALENGTGAKSEIDRLTDQAKQNAANVEDKVEEKDVSTTEPETKSSVSDDGMSDIMDMFNDD